MRVRGSWCWGMYNWALTPMVSVWRNMDGGFGIGFHFLRFRASCYTSKR